MVTVPVLQIQTDLYAERLICKVITNSCAAQLIVLYSVDELVIAASSLDEPPLCLAGQAEGGDDDLDDCKRYHDFNYDYQDQYETPLCLAGQPGR